MAKQVQTVEELKRLMAHRRGNVFSAEDQIVEERVEGKVDKRVKEVLMKSTAKTRELEAKLEKISQSLEIQKKRTSPTELREAMLELFCKYDFSPAEELILMLKEPRHEFYIQDTNLRVKTLCEVQKYVMPALRSVEHKGEVEHNHTIKILRIGADGGAQLEDAPERKKAPVIDIPEIKETVAPRKEHEAVAPRKEHSG